MADQDPKPGTWKLEEAQARFPELVRRAQTEGPQIVSVDGRSSVTVTAAPLPSEQVDYDVDLGTLLRNSPLSLLPDDVFERVPYYPPVRPPFQFDE